MGVSISSLRQRPILVTGMPRSGTTWLARLLSTAERYALPGREPMNPRGRQYGLSGSLPGWVRLTNPSRQQRRVLRLAYTGTNPWGYSRYGRRQWMAPIPFVGCVVKDPFAMLSVPAVLQATGARAVLVYRHPGAMLVSYRRMGWTPDVDEVVPIVERFLSDRGPTEGVELPPPGGLDEVGTMGWFWNTLYGIALRDIDQAEVDIVSHQELALGGDASARRLFRGLGLQWTADSENELRPDGSREPQASALHNLSRDPTSVAAAWREQLRADQVESLDEQTLVIRRLLQERRLPLAVDGDTIDSNGGRPEPPG